MSLFDYFFNDPIMNYDSSKKLLRLIDKFKHDPVTLIYLTNYLTKSYTLDRVISLQSSNIKGRTLYPDIELIPPKMGCFTEIYSGRQDIENQINLQSSSIIPWAWNKSRIHNALSNIGSINNPWKFDEINHNVVFIFPTCHTIVYGGNHSLTSGILKGINYQFTNNRIFNISQVYSKVRYSKKVFKRESHSIKIDKNQIISGIIFEIGRLILESGFSYEDYLNQYKLKYDPMSSKIAELFKQLDVRLELFFFDQGLNPNNFS